MKIYKRKIQVLALTIIQKHIHVLGNKKEIIINFLVQLLIDSINNKNQGKSLKT